MTREEITDIFSSRFPGIPEVIVRAPGRINLIGEHTDYNDGFVLPASIEQSIWVAVRRNGLGEHHFYSAEYDAFFKCSRLSPATDTASRWADYLMGAIHEMRAEGCETAGMDIAVGGNIPLGAGLSSSAALTSAVALAVNELCATGLSRSQIARVAQRAENNFVGMQCGIMDMFASLMGKQQHVLRLDCRTLEYIYAPFPNDGYQLLLLDSGVKHQLIDSDYNTRRKECETGVGILQKYHPEVRNLRDATPEMVHQLKDTMPDTIFRRCLFVTEENERVNAVCEALKQKDMELVGQLMSQSHAGLRDLYEVCVDETNFLVNQMSGIALGARQMGGGFGGCTINLLRQSIPESDLEHLKAAYFDRFGLKIRVLPVTISDGAYFLQNFNKILG